VFGRATSPRWSGLGLPGPRAAFLAVLAFVVLGASALHTERIGVFVDDAIYLASGIELGHGRGYRVSFLPGSPLAGKYPPLYPVVLGVASWVVPDLPAGLVYYKALTLLLALPGIVLLVVWLRRLPATMGEGAAPWLVLIGTATCAELAAFSAEVMSEAPFFSLVMAALVAVQAVERSGTGASVHRSRWQRHAYAWALVFAVLATYTRSLGALLLLVLLVNGLGWRGIRRASVDGIAVLAALAPWWWWSHVHVPRHEPAVAVLGYLTSYGYHLQALREYFGSLSGDPLDYVSLSLRATIRGIGAVVLPWPNRAGADDVLGPVHASAWGVCVLVAVGLFTWLRRGSVAAQFLFVYLVSVTVWPWLNKVRFFVVVVPLLLLCVAEGVRRLLARVPRAQLPACLGLTLLVVVSNVIDHAGHAFLMGSASDLIAGASRPPASAATERAFAWLRRSTPRDAVLLTGLGGPLFAFHTGRSVLPYEAALDTPGRGLSRILHPDLALPHSRSLSDLVADAHDLIGSRPLYQVRLCRQACEAPSAGATWDVVFEESASSGGAIAIRRFSIGSSPSRD